MRSRSIPMSMVMLVAGVAWAAPPSSPETTQPAPSVKPSQPLEEREPVAGRTGEEGVIEPEADAALRRMSNYLGGLRSFRVDITSVDEKVATDGQKIQEVKETKVALRRPGSLL